MWHWCASHSISSPSLPPSPNKCSANPHFHFFCSPKLIIHHHLPFSWWLWSHNNWYLASVVQSLQWRGVICAMATTRPRCNAGTNPKANSPFDIPKFLACLSQWCFSAGSLCIYWTPKHCSVYLNNPGSSSTFFKFWMWSGWACGCRCLWVRSKGKFKRTCHRLRQIPLIGMSCLPGHSVAIQSLLLNCKHLICS